MKDYDQFTTVRKGFALTIAICWLPLTGCQFAASGQNAQGVRLFEQGQYSGAMQQFQQAIASDPKNPESYYNLAATVHKLGKERNDPKLLEQAESLYNQCLDLDSNHVDCHRGLAVLLVETDRPDRAFALLKNWAVANPQLADARIELARLYDEFGDPETAKMHLNQAVMIDQHDARAWAALGRLREQSGEYQQALANYQRSVQLNQFQPAVTERIAAINKSFQGDVGAPNPNGTRTVSNTTPVRY